MRKTIKIAFGSLLFEFVRCWNNIQNIRLWRNTVKDIGMYYRLGSFIICTTLEYTIKQTFKT